MYYFEQENNEIKKYKISYNKKEIESLRLKAINNCSEIIHKNDRSSGRLTRESADDKLKIRNYKEEYLGWEEDRWGERSVYELTYDEYNFPYLVTLIDRLLNNDVNVLIEIFNPDFSKENIVTIDEMVKRMMKELDEMDNLDRKRKKAKLDELQSLLEKAQSNKNQESVAKYYDELQKLIVIEYMDSIELDSVIRIASFYEKPISTFSFNDTPKKVLHLKY